MSTHRVIYRVVPESHEDIYGYLARVATRNHLAGLHSILSEVLGVKQAAISFGDLPALADFCRLYPEEMVNLSGIVRKTAYGALAWQVCGQWVSKEPFIATRRAKVCPLCLRDAGFVRGEWTLNFYTACAHHSVALNDHCPRCRRAIPWNRRTARYCPCGCDLAMTDAPSAQPHGLFVAELIAHQCGQRVPLRPYPCISFLEHENLATLSLDGLCKTLWFLGHCLCELGRYSVGHGRMKPMPSDADAIILNALQAIEDWPKRFGELLEVSKHRANAERAGPLLEQLLGPVHKYLQRELQDDELTFVRVAYEQHLRNIWRSFGSRHQRRRTDRQLELDLGQ